MIIIMKTVPAFEPVASYRTSMIGYMVGVLVTLSRSLEWGVSKLMWHVLRLRTVQGKAGRGKHTQGRREGR